MADCVKLSVIDAIAAEVEGVSRIKSVTVSPSTPIERDTTQMPAAFLFDEDESVTARNRVEQGTFRLTIQIYREGYAYRRELENDRAEVKKSLYAATQNDGALHALSARGQRWMILSGAPSILWCSPAS